jgi:uncharacterized protein (DUF4415 family)
MKRRIEIENLGDIQGQPSRSDFESLRKIQAEQFERDKTDGKGATNALDDAEFLSLDEFKAKLKPLRKKAVSIRLDADVLAWVQSGGRGYQTMLNALLRELKDGKLELIESRQTKEAATTPWPPLLRKRESAFPLDERKRVPA